LKTTIKCQVITIIDSFGTEMGDPNSLDENFHSESFERGSILDEIELHEHSWDQSDYHTVHVDVHQEGGQLASMKMEYREFNHLDHHNDLIMESFAKLTDNPIQQSSTELSSALESLLILLCIAAAPIIQSFISRFLKVKRCVKPQISHRLLDIEEKFTLKHNLKSLFDTASAIESAKDAKRVKNYMKSNLHELEELCGRLQHNLELTNGDGYVDESSPDKLLDDSLSICGGTGGQGMASPAGSSRSWCSDEQVPFAQLKQLYDAYANGEVLFGKSALAVDAGAQLVLSVGDIGTGTGTGIGTDTGRNLGNALCDQLLPDAGSSKSKPARRQRDLVKAISRQLEVVRGGIAKCMGGGGFPSGSGSGSRSGSGSTKIGLASSPREEKRQHQLAKSRNAHIEDKIDELYLNWDLAQLAMGFQKIQDTVTQVGSIYSWHLFQQARQAVEDAVNARDVCIHTLNTYISNIS
jgi:hypothetical protein